MAAATAPRPARVDTDSARQRPWTVLMVAADPSAHARLRLQAEERAIRQALEGGSGIRLDVLPAATLDDLAQRLLEQSARGHGYDVIHFSGHCSVHAHMLELIYAELASQHGEDARARVRADADCARAVAELAEQVVQHLEAQSAHLVDAVDATDAEASAHPHEDEPQLCAPRRRSRSCEPRNGGGAISSSSPRGRRVARSVGPPQHQPPSTPRADANPADDNDSDAGSRCDEPAASLELQPRPVFLPAPRHGGGARPRAHVPTSAADADGSPLVLRVPLAAGARDVVLTKRQILDAGVGSLAFESHAPRAPVHFVSARAFAAVLAPYAASLRCVTLNACHAQLVCEQLLAHGVPLAVCARGRLSDSAALHFSRGFYQAVAAGGSVERAFAEGRNRLRAHARPLADAPLALAARPQTHAQTHAHAQARDTDSVALLRARGGVRLAAAAVDELRQTRRENARLRDVIRRGARMLEQRDKEVAALRVQLAALNAQRPRSGASTPTRGRQGRVAAPASPGSGKRTVRVRVSRSSKAGRASRSDVEQATSSQRSTLFEPRVGASDQQQQQQQQQQRAQPAFGSGAPRFPRTQVPDITRYERAPKSPTK